MVTATLEAVASVPAVDVAAGVKSEAVRAGATSTVTVSPLATPLSSKSMLTASTTAEGSLATWRPVLNRVGARAVSVLDTGVVLSWMGVRRVGLVGHPTLAPTPIQAVGWCSARPWPLSR
jgi:hypothetical protein